MVRFLVDVLNLFITPKHISSMIFSNYLSILESDWKFLHALERIHVFDFCKFYSSKSLRQNLNYKQNISNCHMKNFIQVENIDPITMYMWVSFELDKKWKHLFHIKRGVPQTTSVCSKRAVIFEVSCKSISRKRLSLIKIKNCLRGVCLIQGL